MKNGPFKVLMTDTVFEDVEIEKKIIENFGAEFIFASSMNEDEILEISRDCDAIIDVYCPITEKILKNSPKIKIVVRSGTGVDTIDIPAADRLGIIVSNVPDYCIDEVADHTLALMLNISRKVTFLNNRIKNKDKNGWDMNSAKPMYRLRGQTLGILGFGNIARQVAVRAQGFGIKTLAYDQYVDGSLFSENNTKRADSLDQVVQQADILTLHIPYLPQNHHIIDQNMFRQMKPSAILVNTARGPLVAENDLVTALKKGIIAGAGLDVTEQEPVPHSSKLLTFENVILTPHIGYYSEQSIAIERQRMAEEVVSVLSGREPRSFYNRKTIKGRR